MKDWHCTHASLFLSNLLFPFFFRVPATAAAPPLTPQPPKNAIKNNKQNKADETSSAFQKELARRASGGRGPAESSSSRSGDAASRAAASRPRWAPDAIRGAQQPPPSPPPSMNRGGPVPEQLQASRDLVNEGLSGLIPRAKVLLTVGAAVPTAFGGLIAVAVCVFAVLALGLEDKFIHGAL